MTGLSGDQVAVLVQAVFVLLGGMWQPVRGRRRVLGLYRAVVLTLYALRRNESQAVAGELFGCSQPSVSRIVARLRPLLRQATAEHAGQVRRQARRSAVLVDGFESDLTTGPYRQLVRAGRRMRTTRCAMAERTGLCVMSIPLVLAASRRDRQPHRPGAS